MNRINQSGWSISCWSGSSLVPGVKEVAGQEVLPGGPLQDEEQILQHETFPTRRNVLLSVSVVNK